MAEFIHVPPMPDVMLDLETMGTRPNAPIVAIGAVRFDTGTGELGDEFYETVDLASAINAGAVMEPDTVLWWMKQSATARKAVTRPGKHIARALTNFSYWLNKNNPVGDSRIWGNGASFDNALLAEAFKRNGWIVPWKFWNDRCYRTVAAEHPDIERPKPAIAHHALEDAKAQARHMILIRSAL